MKKRSKRGKGKARKAKRPKKMTITKTRTKTRVTVKNPSPAYARVKKQLERSRAEGRRLRRELAAKKRNPRRPPKRWFERCLASTTAQRYARDPAAVCGAAWWKMPVKKREAIVRRWERGSPRQRRVAVAVAKAERNRADGPPKRRKNPRELVSVVYEEKKPGDDRPYEYEHEFEGKRPKLTMRRGKAQIEGGSYHTKGGWLHG